MAESKAFSFTNGLDASAAAGEVDRFVELVKMNRKGFERRWYDNNFFDDGYHFRYVSRTTGRIVDQYEKNLSFAPNRAIPKASRQIRGVANLILQVEPTPVIYPEYIPKSSYPDIPVSSLPPELQQQLQQQAQGKPLPLALPDPSYKQALDQAKMMAQKQGAWVGYEWEQQELKDKLVLMVILAAKHGVSFMQVWPDDQDEKIRTKVYDAFDIWLMGQYDDIEESPMIVKTASQLISQIKSNENFDEEQRLKISPDNKFATSEIKQAYMQNRFGSGVQTDTTATLQLKEAFIPEHLTVENAMQIAKDLGDDFKKLDEGDKVIRQVFTAGGVWLYDKYTRLNRYPIVDYRMEPGPIYQVPLIERFIPANKSLDIIMSRIERYMNTMTVGMFQKRKGENYQVSNSSSAQVIEYEQAPLEQLKVETLPPSLFNFIEILEHNIEEQGASVSTLNQLPKGVEASKAIETLKANEYSNLKIPTDQLKKTVKHITERMLDIAANHFVTPQTVYAMDKSEPSYFEIIGEVGMTARKKAKMKDQFDGVVIKGDMRVRIEVESGLGFTEAGKKQTMQEIITFMESLMQNQLVTTDAVKIIIQKFLDTFSFGSTQEFMDALDSGTATVPLTDDQIAQIKIAMLEVMKDLKMVGPQADQKLVDSTKVGTLETLKETGMLDKQSQEQPAKESVSIAYKDMPEDIKRQAEAKAGFNPSQTISPAGSDQLVKHQAANRPQGGTSG